MEPELGGQAILEIYSSTVDATTQQQIRAFFDSLFLLSVSEEYYAIRGNLLYYYHQIISPDLIDDITYSNFGGRCTAIALKLSIAGFVDTPMTRSLIALDEACAGQARDLSKPLDSATHQLLEIRDHIDRELTRVVIEFLNRNKAARYLRYEIGYGYIISELIPQKLRAGLFIELLSVLFNEQLLIPEVEM